MKSLQIFALVIVAVAAAAVPAESQVPVRARSDLSIPIKKNAELVAAPVRSTRLVPGSRRDVIGPSRVTHLVVSQPGTATMFAVRAPMAEGGFGVPWLPLFGLLGGGILLHGLDTDHGGGETPMVPVVPVPPVIPPVIPPPTTVPEPSTLILVVTGLAALLFGRRFARHRRI